MNTVSFDISSALLTEGNQRVLEPDKQGIYRGMVLMVLGKVSRNNKDYEVSSMCDAIANNDSIFFKKLTAGQLFGELGHPMIKDESDLGRLMQVDPTRVSHQIHRVYTGKATEQGHVLVYGDIEPCLPYGPVLDASLRNPRRNTAFSLRSLVTKTGQVGSVIKQRVNALVTVDTVDAPGYMEASKVRIAAQEGLSVDIDVSKHLSCISELIGCENITDQELLDMLQANKVVRVNTLHGIVDVGIQSVRTDSGNKQIFHNIFK